MSSGTEPLILEYGDDVRGLRVVRQPPPVGAASFSASYVGPAGWGFDPSSEEGVARFVNQLVSTAAGPYDRVALARLLDRAGATLSRQTSPEAAEVTIWGPAADWRKLLALLSVIVLQPRFDAEDLVRVRRQMLERQLRARTQPASRAEVELLGGVYPKGHPYRLLGLGDRKSVARISGSRLRRFHRDHYTSGDACVVVTTAAPLSAVENEVADHFGSFPVRSGGRLRLPKLPEVAPRKIMIDLEGRSQVEVRVGGPSVPQSSRDYPGAFLANEALGGRPMLARLFQRVRERSGLAYHASSHLDTMHLGGTWSVRAGTGADRWRKVVPMLEQEVAHLRRDPIPSRELSLVRESAIGEIPLALESTAEAHELAVDAAYHELPPDFWSTWPAQLRKVTPRDITRSVGTAFDRNCSVTVVVGPIGPV